MQDNIVKVLLNAEEIGKIYWDERSNRAVFSYNPSFVKKGIDIAPLTASIKGNAGKGFPVVGNKEKLFQGLPPFIADSLPDRWGNKVFEQWAAQNHIPLRQLSPVDKLSFIGKRGMGALEFAPATTALETSSSVQIDSLYQLAKKLFEERKEAIVLPGEELSLQSLYEVGTSAGGQHPKAIIAINRKTGDIRSGQVTLPKEYTYYILKFAESDDFPFTNVEMTYYDMALEAGINMMPSELIFIEGQHHFITERYDRKEGKKVHTQTLAAMCPDATSYEELFATCRRLNIAATEIAEEYRRMVFNVMGANVDDHIKNFSFMMDEKAVWHITPAYDMTFTTNLDGASYENGHSMTILGKSSNITISDLVQFAKENSIKNELKIISSVALAISHFYDYASKHQVNPYWADRIEQHLSQLVPEKEAKTMQHYLPTILEPYITENGLHVSDFKLTETIHHDFQLFATIEGEQYKYIVGRKSELAKQIITDGRSKMHIDKIKTLISMYLCPLALRKR
jgi:HipA-like C-terminal domain./HipA-like N-terminal domain.